MDTGKLIYLKLRPLKSNLLNQEVNEITKCSPSNYCKSRSVIHFFEFKVNQAEEQYKFTRANKLAIILILGVHAQRSLQVVIYISTCQFLSLIGKEFCGIMQMVNQQQFLNNHRLNFTFVRLQLTLLGLPPVILGLKEKNRAFHSKNMRNLNSTGGSGVGSGIFISVFRVKQSHYFESVHYLY